MARDCDSGSVKTLVTRSGSYAVDARGLVRVYRRSGGRAFARFGAFNQNGVPIRGRLVLSTTAAISATGTPTPLGRFYINQRFQADPDGPYGWAAIGISAFSGC
jgi:hypothetical protein